jgi:hypothetical protein
MHAVTGAYAKPIFVDKLGASPVFSGWHILKIVFNYSIISVTDVSSACRIQFQMGYLWRILVTAIQILILRKMANNF